MALKIKKKNFNKVTNMAEKLSRACPSCSHCESCSETAHSSGNTGNTKEASCIAFIKYKYNTLDLLPSKKN